MEIIIEDLNYHVAHEDLNASHIKAGYSSNPYQLLRGIMSIVYHVILAVPSFFYRDYYQKLIPNKYVFLGFTVNNYRSLAPIQEKMECAAIYKLDDLPFKRVWIYALLFFPIVLLKYFRSSGYMRKAYASEFVSFSCSYGLYIEAKKILNRINPVMVIVANDHSLYQRSFFKAAQRLGIKIAYVQHASVTENFPLLEFDYAFLDGQESLDKYTANNKICKSNVFLCGSPRFDIIKSLNIKAISLKNKCGIAINSADSLDKIAELIWELQGVDNIITIRIHPSMDEKFWRTFANKNNCFFSDAKTENPFQFIAQNDFFIAGESSFHLDVSLTGKISFFYNFTDKPLRDHYSYLKNGLIKVLPNDFVQIEHYKNDCKQRAILIQYYVSNYDTLFWGKAAEVIRDTVLSLIESNKVPDFWKLEYCGVYTLKE